MQYCIATEEWLSGQMTQVQGSGNRDDQSMLNISIFRKVLKVKTCRIRIDVIL